MTERKRPPFWKSEWFIMLSVIGVLHFTGMLVHVQAALQRVILTTGIFHAELRPIDERPAADLDLLVSTADGPAESLTSLEGEVLFVNFWASWCAPCLAEMPAIESLRKEYGDRVQFVMISMDSDREQADQYVRQKGYDFPIRFPASPVPRTLSTGTLPTTLVVDRAGRIAVRHEGMAAYNSNRFRKTLDVLLGEGRPAD